VPTTDYASAAAWLQQAEQKRSSPDASNVPLSDTRIVRRVIPFSGDVPEIPPALRLGGVSVTA